MAGVIGRADSKMTQLLMPHSLVRMIEGDILRRMDRSTGNSGAHSRQSCGLRRGLPSRNADDARG
jgi:hypothetical protein